MGGELAQAGPVSSSGFAPPPCARGRPIHPSIDRRFHFSGRRHTNWQLERQLWARHPSPDFFWVPFGFPPGSLFAGETGGGFSL
jgi:hypothetical protein